MKLDASQVQCQVLTYKEGLLSAVAHDLLIDVTRFSLHIEREKGSTSATFDATSLRVRCAMKDGVEKPDSLSAKDKRDIEGNIAKDVLLTKKHPEIVFQSNSMDEIGGTYRVSGRLQLVGKIHNLAFDVVDKGSCWEAKVSIHQPDFGIKPYSAMLGTLKIKAEVHVLVRIPKDVLT